MNLTRLGYVFGLILLTFVAFPSKSSAQAVPLSIRIENNNLYINSCSSNLVAGIGYKGYADGIEIFSTGDFGGFPCYNGDLFINNLTSFYSANTGQPFVSNFDFYVNSSFNQPPTKTFQIVFDGTNFSVPGQLTGNSNVMFFPGVMSSRLYEEVGTVDCSSGLVSNDCIRESELWVSVLDANHSRLELNSNGDSVNNIFTKDDTQSVNDENETGIIDEAYGTDVYNSFINSLSSWKSDGIINDYHFIPYDWRLSLDDVINNGATTTSGRLTYRNDQNFSESYILKKLEDLQKTSGSGKVTLIGHSNGGLVIKALVQKLKDTNNPLYEKIDQIILVAVPQVGTPDALVALLHGKPLGYGAIMGNARARQLVENMPSLYNLLPTESYFDSITFSSTTPAIVNFEDHVDFVTQLNEYGTTITNEDELENFIVGTDGRNKPSFSDTVNPNIGNSVLYTRAESTHSVLDNFEPASTTKVIQVAGWGVETISGLDYVIRRSADGFYYKSYKVQKVIDGDGTVVVPSALWMSTTNSSIERWWVNLEEYNSDNAPDRVHKNILEISNLQDFIESKISNSSFIDNENIVVNNASTLLSSETRLHYTLHSPLTLGVTDSQGRYTGLDPVTGNVKDEIPDVFYEQIGEVQFISAPSDLALTLKMKGLDNGSFSLDIDKQQGNTILDSVSFQAIPTNTSTLVDMPILPNINISSSTLNIDNNGDGNVDKVLGFDGESTVVYDTITPELKVTFDLLSKDVVLVGTDNLDPNPTLVVSTTSVKIIDNQKNVTEIPFVKLKDKPTKLKFVYNKIVRNGLEIEVPNTHIVYDWQEKKGVLTDLDTRVFVKGVEKYVFSYKKVQDKTVIKERSGNNVVTTTRSGFVPVTVQTEGSLLNVTY
jgi:pimeloyl-ACP methyl ester carboxylesterase